VLALEISFAVCLSVSASRPGDDHLRVALGETLRSARPNAPASAGNQHYLIRNVDSLSCIFVSPLAFRSSTTEAQRHGEKQLQRLKTVTRGMIWYR